jgi:lipoate synthase
MYIRCFCCYMFRSCMDHHQATLVILGDHCTIHFVLSTFRHTAVFVVVGNWLRMIFSSYLF